MRFDTRWHELTVRTSTYVADGPAADGPGTIFLTLDNLRETKKAGSLVTKAGSLLSTEDLIKKLDEPPDTTPKIRL